MKKVLIITYYWPPASSPGVQRWLKFVKYLVLQNIKPIVLTVSNPSVPFEDETLLADVPKEVEVIKTKSLEPILLYNLLRGKNSREVEVGLGELKQPKTPVKKLAKYLRSNIFIPDAKIGWYYKVRKKAIDLVKKKGINTIITTGPPHTTHLIGDFIKSRVDVRWIVDFRDPWTGLFYEKYLSRSEKSKQKNKALEKKVLQNGDHIITVSKGLKNSFRDYNENITVIPNGFDIDDLPEFEHIPTQKFTLTYTGNFKVNQNIEALWKAIYVLCKDDDFKNNFQLLLVGNINEEVKNSIYDFGLEKTITISPFVKHTEAIKLMMQANLLLLPIPQSKGNELIITGKIFEYLASKTPILSIGPENGDASKILAECDRDKMLNYEDVGGIKEQIAAEYYYWKSNKKQSKKHDSNAHLIYSRERLTMDLVNIINN